MNNLLIQADNLQGLHYLLDEKNLQGQIDLIYIDPPFATGSKFTISDHRASTISRVKDGQIAYNDQFGREEFLSFLQQRLLLLRALLSDQGSI